MTHLDRLKAKRDRRLSGFCNPSWSLATPEGRASHDRCTLLDCSCEHHHQETPVTITAAEAPPALEAITPGIYTDMDEPTYLGDKGSISASGAKQLLKSPAHFRLPPWFSDAADLGSAFHTETLGVGQEVVVIDAASWRGKEAAAAQEQARAEGKAPILAKDVPVVKGMAASVRKHPTAARLLEQSGRRELSAFWHDDEWGVTRRARYDHLTDTGVNVDLKSTVSIDKHSIVRKVIDLGYDLSAAWYEDVAHGLDLDLTVTALVFVEKSEPYRVRVVELSGEFIARGRVLARRALEIYRDCLEADLWPNYNDPEFTTIHPPAWAREDIA